MEFGEPVRPLADNGSAIEVTGGAVVSGSLQRVGAAKYSLLVEPEVTGRGCADPSSGLVPAVSGGGCVSVRVEAGSYVDLAGNIGATTDELAITYDPAAYDPKFAPRPWTESTAVVALIWFAAVAGVILLAVLVFVLVRRRYRAGRMVVSPFAAAGTPVLASPAQLGWKMEEVEAEPPRSAGGGDGSAPKALAFGAPPPAAAPTYRIEYAIADQFPQQVGCPVASLCPPSNRYAAAASESKRHWPCSRGSNAATAIESRRRTVVVQQHFLLSSQPRK